MHAKLSTDAKFRYEKDRIWEIEVRITYQPTRVLKHAIYLKSMNKNVL